MPQASDLGPKLFYIYIHGIAEELISSIRLYPDSCVPYYEILSKYDAKELQDNLILIRGFPGALARERF